MFLSFSEGESPNQNTDWTTVIRPSCINDLPEKLLMAGITFPGKYEFVFGIFFLVSFLVDILDRLVVE